MRSIPRILASLVLFLAATCGVLFIGQPADAQVHGNPNSGYVGVPIVLCKSFAGVSAPADTSEDTLATCTVPANAMGANGVLRIHTLWTLTNNAGAKTLRIRFSGASGTQYLAQSLANNAQAMSLHIIANRGATNSQVGTQSNSVTTINASTNANITSSVDTTASTSVVITAQKASGGDTMTLEGYLVELIR